MTREVPPIPASVRAALTFVLFLSVGAWVGAEDADSNRPEWVYYLDARRAIADRDYGKALAVVKRAVERFGDTAEANYLLGLVYEVEAEYTLAERYYYRALERRRDLYVAEDAYAILYRLAAMYRIQKKYKDFEERLLEIVSSHATFKDGRYSNERINMLRLLRERGFDEVIVRYRFRGDRYARAHAELGELYCLTGRYNQAVLHLTLASVLILSSATEELRRMDRGFAFVGLTRLFDAASAHPHIRRFIDEAGLTRVLYFLGASILTEGLSGEAARLWQVVVQFGEGEWKTRALNQLRSPRPEPLISF